MKTSIRSLAGLWFGIAAASPAQAGVGNGLPDNPTYNLEIIAHKACKSEPLTGSDRHTIFLAADYQDNNVSNATRVTLDQTNKIWLSEGDYKVLDGNACDGNGGRFQLPANPFTCAADDPACENPTFQAYNVYIRLVGKPGTGVKATTCGFAAGLDGILGTDDDVAICSGEAVVEVRSTGKKKFRDVTKELTTVYADVNGDGLVERLGLFDPGLVDYFWAWDTKGKAHAQIFFVALGK